MRNYRAYLPAASCSPAAFRVERALAGRHAARRAAHRRSCRRSPAIASQDQHLIGRRAPRRRDDATTSRGCTGATRSPRSRTFVSYYERQTQGKTIHSPRNCLPGAGWEVLTPGTRIW